MFQESDPAHVARRIPGVCALVVIFLQLAEVWRQQPLVIALDSEVDAIRDERWGVAEQVDVFVDLFDHLERQLVDESAVGDQENRDLLIAAAYGSNDLQRGAFIELMV